MACPVQIVKTGNGEENLFQLDENNVSMILQKIPNGTKVAVVSVVGAFRTGKSFLLTFFLRYLRHGSCENLSCDWMISDGENLEEGNMNESKADVTLRENGFAWRGGQDRQTTGIWMWSEPFIRKVSHSPEPIAILLIDTQGMFDNETTMALTAQIFGLSTLISSYQIYNVDKRIQEDNLQHLALFSEYGRMALHENNDDEVKKDNVDTDAGATQLADEKTTTEISDVPVPPMKKPTSSSRIVSSKPFQRIEFLVRDWQNFNIDWEEETAQGGEDKEREVFQRIHAEMNGYLGDVIRSRGAADLQSTRDQITRCFEKVGCFLLPHPGFAVTKKAYTGEISKIEVAFRGLLNQYVRLIFDELIEPKQINERFITAPELLTFIEVYAALFRDGGKSFPKAMTMLEATADANNRNAFDLSLEGYKKSVGSVAGPNCAYTKEMNLLTIHEKALAENLQLFDSIANMGSESAIEKKRNQLLSDIEDEKNRFVEANKNRNPFKNVEYYAVPVIIASISWFISVMVDITCSTDICERAEDGFQNIYRFIFFVLIVFTWRYFAGSFAYLKEVIPLVVGGDLKGSSATEIAGNLFAAVKKKQL